MALVNVIIPYYKKINYIKKTIQSVLNQTFEDFEIIIYDDSKCDDLKVIENFIENHPKIKIIKNEKILGLEFLKYWNTEFIRKNYCFFKL